MRCAFGCIGCDLVNRLPSSLKTDHKHAKLTRFFDATYTHLEENQRSNLLLSPLSASYAFSMLTNGANGQTRDALMEVLGFQALDGERWNRLVKQLSYQDVDLRLPKFTVRKSYDLTKTVKAMGLDHLFMQPDFSLLSDDPLFVSLIQQDVYIRVDEEGTEAAAVTGIGDVTAAPPMAQDCINFHVTRPFLYVLKEISTGTILFIGQTDQL